MPLFLEALGATPVGARRVELVERKGLGHPDMICDSLVEAISLELNRMYIERLGAIAHYNIDKALLVAGRSVKGFGRGDMTHPMEFVVGDHGLQAPRGLARADRAVRDTLEPPEAIDEPRRPRPPAPAIQGGRAHDGAHLPPRRRPRVAASRRRRFTSCSARTRKRAQASAR